MRSQFSFLALEEFIIPVEKTEKHTYMGKRPETKSKDKGEPREKMWKSCNRHKAVFNI